MELKNIINICIDVKRPNYKRKGRLWEQFKNEWDEITLLGIKITNNAIEWEDKRILTLWSRSFSVKITWKKEIINANW